VLSILDFSFHSQYNFNMYLNIPGNKPTNTATVNPVARPRVFSAINGVIVVAK
tara:strand:+ start:4027 stop:4185 length:159 start_codon:yes stop_codon:yes gene_type:complete